MTIESEVILKSQLDKVTEELKRMKSEYSSLHHTHVKLECEVIEMLNELEEYRKHISPETLEIFKNKHEGDNNTFFTSVKFKIGDKVARMVTRNDSHLFQLAEVVGIQSITLKPNGEIEDCDIQYFVKPIDSDSSSIIEKQTKLLSVHEFMNYLAGNEFIDSAPFEDVVE